MEGGDFYLRKKGRERIFSHLIEQRGGGKEEKLGNEEEREGAICLELSTTQGKEKKKERGASLLFVVKEREEGVERHGRPSQLS